MLQQQAGGVGGLGGGGRVELGEEVGFVLVPKKVGLIIPPGKHHIVALFWEDLESPENHRFWGTTVFWGAAVVWVFIFRFSCLFSRYPVFLRRSQLGSFVFSFI